MREASLRLDVHLWIKVASVSLKISENLKILYSFRILCCEGTNKSIHPFSLVPCDWKVSNILAPNRWHSHTGRDYKHKLVHTIWAATIQPPSVSWHCQSSRTQLREISKLPLYDSPCYLPSINKPVVRASQTLHLQGLLKRNKDFWHIVLDLHPLTE